ncbi:MAG: hypothetical protein ABWX67_01405 [Allosphingosinicella sp.]
MTDAIHIHEDDWAMRNLYPAETAGEVAGEMRAAHEAGERNRAPDGVGWTDIHLIEPPSFDYSNVGLTLAEAAAALEPILPRIKRFNATIFSSIGAEERDPLGSYEEECWCFGRSENCFIKLEPEGELVRDIWFELRGTDPADAAAIRAAIEAVDRLAPSYLADYRLSFEAPVDGEGLDEYFALHAAREAELASMFRGD